MKVLTLPNSSKTVVVVCLAVQAFDLYLVAIRHHRNLWLLVIALFVGGYVTDLISGIFHFSFDYVWPPTFPIMGPISVDFRQHHENPTLDPSALTTNLTKGAYGGLPIALVTWIVARVWQDSSFSFLVLASLMATSLWMLGFHQIHAYAHMGSRLSPDEFNRTVIEIGKLPLQQQERAFADLFNSLGIPRFVRLLQHCKLFLRPEVHWRHHLSFDSDFSSVNGWSDPLMNLLYRPLARRKLAQQSQVRANHLTLRESGSQGDCMLKGLDRLS